MDLRKKFTDDTGGNVFDPRLRTYQRFTFEYVEWLERQLQDNVEVFEFVYNQVDWDEQKFSVRVVAKRSVERQLERAGVKL